LDAAAKNKRKLSKKVGFLLLFSSGALDAHVTLAAQSHQRNQGENEKGGAARDGTASNDGEGSGNPERASESGHVIPAYSQMKGA
jgi:hypothetical protein